MHLIAEDMIGMMDALGIDKAVLVGHSMGGYASLAFAQAFPDRLLGLALVASHARPDTPEGRLVRLDTARKVMVNGMSEIAELMPSRLTSRTELHASLRTLILDTKPAGAAGILRGMAERPDSTPSLPQIKVPSLVIAGGSDELIPLAWSKELDEKLANSKMLIIPAAGHIPMLENPHETGEALLELIIRVENGEDVRNN